MVQNILLSAKEYSHKSLAFSSTYMHDVGYPVHEVISVLFDEISSFVMKNCNALSLVHFVSSDDEICKKYMDEHSKRIFSFTTLPNMVECVHKNQHCDATNSLKCEIVFSDITQIDSNVIVNCTTVDMSADANIISKGIHDAAGFELEETCKYLVEQGVVLNVEYVVPTNASGVLCCERIYHINIPKLQQLPPSYNDINILSRTIYNCFTLAEEEMHTSLSIPGYCFTNGNEVLVDLVRSLTQAVSNFDSTNPVHLRNIYVVDSNQGEYRQLIEKYSHCLSDAKFQSTHHADDVAAESTKNDALFKIYGFVKEEVNAMQHEVIKLLNQVVISVTVNFDDIVGLLTVDDVNMIYELSEKNNVEINIQNALERVIVTGERQAVEKVCYQLQVIQMDLSYWIKEVHGYVYEWSVCTNVSQTTVYAHDICLKLEVAHRRGKNLVKFKQGDIMCTIDVQNMKEFGFAEVARVVKRKCPKM